MYFLSGRRIEVIGCKESGGDAGDLKTGESVKEYFGREGEGVESGNP